jgi:hypothetical protein
MVRLLWCSASVRTLAVLMLVWVGFDFGVHGLVAPDGAPMVAAASPASLGAGRGGGNVTLAPDQCFCHSVSVGALTPLRQAFFEFLGNAETPLCPPAPHTERHPLDQPPRLAA